MNKIFEIYSEVKNEAGKLNGVRFKEIKTDTQISFFLIWNGILDRHEVCISVASPLDLQKLPKWDGLEFTNEDGIKVDNADLDGVYFHLIQIQDIDNEGKIFTTIIADLYDALTGHSLSEANSIIFKELKFWEDYFKNQSPLIMSEEKQQGLFGELLFLKSLIDWFGPAAVNSWVGVYSKDHDFGFRRNSCNIAAEVKTSRRGTSRLISISNEYQLSLEVESSEVAAYNKLFLVFYPLEENKANGMTLPALIESIFNSIPTENIEIIESLNEKLRYGGYMKNRSEEYTFAFLQRDKPYYYRVDDGFPRLSRKENLISDAVEDIQYKLNLSGCEKYRRTKDELIEEISEAYYG